MVDRCSGIWWTPLKKVEPFSLREKVAAAG